MLFRSDPDSVTALIRDIQDHVGIRPVRVPGRDDLDGFITAVKAIERELPEIGFTFTPFLVTEGNWQFLRFRVANESTADVELREIEVTMPLSLLEPNYPGAGAALPPRLEITPQGDDRIYRYHIRFEEERHLYGGASPRELSLPREIGRAHV